ncbi:hypothetical protein [Longimicrobium terrae]|uniref:6-bladed beta-propeller n=1 Tax=Longimicrobium terrae TaxID=1639882 RepID=A0A841H0I1_9BACT|nr:hypothetical protein [Longimicrobium terrae]MBB4636926.1 hypothetical protein [Longimicrobium terrae]MBB6071466.1 hypothetical protein [Longimicrobium terrae]NNC31317.1 hypothetical protein [Longimicrobium terrae]
MREIGASGEDASFTAITTLDVDSRGMIYVPDTYRQQITVLGPDGRWVRSFGRRGAGPGEFRAIRGVQLLAGDSLLAYDPSLGRVTVFAPGSDQAAYSVNLAARLGGAAPFDLRRTHDGSTYLALFRPMFAFGQGGGEARQDRVRHLGADGSPRADLLRFPSRAFLVAGTSVMPHPFGREGFARLDSGDRVFFIQSDSLAADIYNLAGQRTGRFAVPYTPPAITRADQDDALAAMPAVDRPVFAPVLKDSLPERWPAVRGVLLDDRDRIWMQLGGGTRRNAEWAAFDGNGSYLGSMLIPAGSEVRLIRGDGTVYASRADSDDVPHVVVYRMARTPR